MKDKSKKRSMARWTGSEIELLKSMWMQKDDGYFARVFHRSEKAVRQKRIQLGLTIRKQRKAAKDQPEKEEMKLPFAVYPVGETKVKETPKKKVCKKCGFIKIGWFKFPVYLEE